MEFNLHHIVVFTKNMARAIEFYTNILHLELRYQSPHWSEVGNSPYLGLHLTEDDIPTPELAAPQITFATADIQATKAYLTQQNVPIIQDIQEIAPGKLIFHATDPDGNTIVFFEDSSTRKPEA